METNDAGKIIEPFSWVWKITKRRRHHVDPFFEEGNIVCNLEIKQWTVSESIEELLHCSSVPQFSCHVSTCRKTFTSVAKYELHYNSEHRHTCSQCHRTFPNSHILDIHVLEWHDSMFQLLSQKQNMYECLMEGCGQKFLTAKERKDHLIKTHKYPSNFRFDRPVQGRKKKNDLKQNEGNGARVEAMEAEVMKENTAPIAGITDNPAVETTQKRFQYSYKVPKNICFGQGSQRGFQRPPGGKGKKRSRKKHWHENADNSMETNVNIEQVDMKDLAKALDS